MDTALSYYPQIAEQIKEVAGNRANLVKKRSQIAAKAAAEGKSAADAAKAAAQGTKDEDDEKDKEKDKPAPPPPPPAASAEKKDEPVEAVAIEEGERDSSLAPRPSHQHLDIICRICPLSIELVYNICM